MPQAAPRRTLLLAAVLLAAPVLAGCIGDDDPSTDAPIEGSAGDASGEPAWAVELPDEITGLERLNTVEDMASGYQFDLDGEIAYVAAWNAGFYTADISDPENPQVLGHVPDHFGHDAWVMHYEDNRSFVALAGSGDGIAMINVTDPREPEIVATILGQEGATDTEGANVHNIAVVPGTHIIYNSRSVDTPGVDIVDASDPENPELVQVFNDVTCHDVSFHMEQAQAFCAGVRETQIWDIADPEAPVITARIHNPAINIHHWALPTEDGETLIIGDEFLGASAPVANACGPGIENPVTGATTTHPVGALWFYDISETSEPTPISYVGASELHGAAETCTAHFGEIVPGQDVILVGFLSGGIYTIDFTDLTAPKVIDHLDIGEVVDVQVHHGYAFGVGRDRGLDTYAILGE